MDNLAFSGILPYPAAGLQVKKFPFN